MSSRDFLIIVINNELFGIETKYIFQLVSIVDIKQINTEIDYIRGMINFHGAKVPVIDLSICLGMQNQIELNINSSMVIVEIRNKKMALIFDEVKSIEKFETNDINTQNLELYKFKNYIEGVVDIKNKYFSNSNEIFSCFLINMEKIIS